MDDTDREPMVLTGSVAYLVERDSLARQVAALRADLAAERARLEHVLVNTHAASEIPGAEEWGDDEEADEGEEGEAAEEARRGLTWFDFLRGKIDDQIPVAPPADPTP